MRTLVPLRAGTMLVLRAAMAGSPQLGECKVVSRLVRGMTASRSSSLRVWRMPRRLKARDRGSRVREIRRMAVEVDINSLPLKAGTTWTKWPTSSPI